MPAGIRADADSYSLATFSSESGPRPLIQADIPTQLKFEDENVLMQYQRLTIDLYSLPCYAAFSTGPLPLGFDYGDFSRAYGGNFRDHGPVFDWTPPFSGGKFRRLLYVSVWATLCGYWLIATILDVDNKSTLARWAPASLSTLLAWFTVTVVSSELRRESYHIHSASATRGLLRKSLMRHRGLVLFALAPLLSIPLEKTRFVSTPSKLFWYYPEVSILTFLSWVDSAMNFEAYIPRASGLRDLGLDRAWQTWILGSDLRKPQKWSSWFDPSDVVKFTHSIIGDSNPYLSGWGNAVEGEAFVMPILVKNIFDSNTISAEIQAYLQLLNPYLDCFLLSQSGPWNTTRTLDVYSVYNCDAHRVKVDSHELDGVSRTNLASTYQDEIIKIQELLEEGHGGSGYARLEKRSEKLRQDRLTLLGSEPLQTFGSQWYSLVEGSDPEVNKPCATSLVFVGDNEPFRSANETVIPKYDLTAAFCEIKFRRRQHLFSLFPRRDAILKKLEKKSTLVVEAISRSGFFIKPADPKTQGAYLDFVNGFVALVDLFSFYRYDPLLWVDHPDGEFFARLIAGRITQLRLWGDAWTTQLLQYGRYDVITATRMNVASLALASKRLCAWIVDQLAESADLALAEIVSSAGGFKAASHSLYETKGRSIVASLQPGTLNTSLWLKITVVVVSLMCTWTITTVCRHSTSTPSGLPWSVETIAAKAALIAHSRLRTTFSAPGHSPDEIRAIPGLHVGSWSRNQEHSSYAWRLDSRCNDIVGKFPHCLLRSPLLGIS